MGNRHNSERDRLIFEKLSRKETTRAAVAREFGINPSRVRQIFMSEKIRVERPDLGFGSLDGPCYRVIWRVLDQYSAVSRNSFTPADLRRFVEEHPDWRFIFRHTGECGKRRLGLITQFLLENGIIHEDPGSVSRHSRKAIKNASKLSPATLAGLKRFVEENPDWEARLSSSNGCEKHALELIKQVLTDAGIVK